MREEIKIGLQSDLTTRVSLSLCVYLSDEKPREYEIIDFFFLGFRVRFFVFFFCLRERRVLVTDISIFLILISYRFFGIVFPVC